MDHSNDARLKGIVTAIAGASAWGLAFIVPPLLPDWSALWITLCRYLFYGVLSAFILLRARRSGMPGLQPAQWRTAALFALLGYLLPYLLLVSSIHDIGAAAPALIMGTSPVAVAAYGNLRRREFPFSRLILPLGAIFAGLAAMNLGRHGLHLGGAGTEKLALGLGKSLASLAGLTWFLVANLVFLRDNPRVGPMRWTNAVGACLGLLSILLLPAAMLESPAATDWRDALIFLALAGLVLGVVSSWVGGALWNRACSLLPASLAGQMIVFWPVSGLILAYIVERRLPSTTEAGGMVLTLAGVAFGIRMASCGGTGKMRNSLGA